eukprot:Seg2275.1 transcript_id=Seg2275.1/GoldUCD/mRNA.D3Y31 product="hypothetical protein" protein_id=Seg2275.1/GoldUCD/D3Y31
MEHDEPCRKNRPTDFTICIRCQTTLKKENLTQPRDTATYEKFLHCIHKRAECGNPDFQPIAARLRGLSATDLQELKALWHRDCYSEATNKTSIQRDEKRHQAAGAVVRKGRGRPGQSELESSDYAEASETIVLKPSPLKRRSSVDTFKRNECFFCQGKDSGKTEEQTRACQSANSAKAIREIVEKSGNRVWKLQVADVIAEDDFLARDIVYHKSCKTKYWKNYIQAPKRRNAAGESDARLIAAKMKFYDDLNERIRGEELISSTDAEKLYRDMMEDHKITEYSISRKVLMEDIRRYLPDIVCTDKKGSKPSLLNSKSIGRDGIDIVTEERDVEKSLKTLFKSAKIIRSKIVNAKKENQWFSVALWRHLANIKPQSSSCF